jgi:hypothetical protein
MQKGLRPMNIAYVSGVLRENRSPDAEGITTRRISSCERFGLREPQP